MLIVGLGNPGSTYEKTFHNMGFHVIDKLAELLRVSVDCKECKALTASVYKNGEKIVLAKPQTYMNLSGESVRELKGRYRETDDAILLVYDDIDLTQGDIRVRKEGSAGTHNGMRNIVALLGATDFPRMRMGIGKPPEFVPLADYVLSKIGGSTADKLTASVDKAARLLYGYIEHRDIDRMMRESK